MIDITYIIIGIIVAASAIATAIKICGNEDSKRLLSWVQIAVSAAEQTIKGTGMGADKKKWVKAFLNKLGYDADLDKIDAIIEAEVFRLHD